MKLSELEIGTIFAIEGTRSYPKLKIKDGYVDLRDNIVKVNPPDWDVEIISKEELYHDFQEKYKESREEVDMQIQQWIEK